MNFVIKYSNTRFRRNRMSELNLHFFYYFVVVCLINVKKKNKLFFTVNIANPVLAEDQSRKREMRLMKNREAARECRRKKKEYIKCLENRVAVLENQNKALIEELKSLKELYCQQKSD